MTNFQVGDRVKINRPNIKNNGKIGTIIAANGVGGYHVKYDDGSEDRYASDMYLLPIATSTQISTHYYQVGDQLVVCNTNHAWYGIVVVVNSLSVIPNEYNVAKLSDRSNVRLLSGASLCSPYAWSLMQTKANTSASTNINHQKFNVGDEVIVDCPEDLWDKKHAKILQRVTGMSHTHYEIQHEYGASTIIAEEYLKPYSSKPFFGVDRAEEKSQYDEKQEAKVLNFVTLKEAMAFDMQMRKPKYDVQGAKWIKEGKCPQCGELGSFSHLQAVCSKHGPY